MKRLAASDLLSLLAIYAPTPPGHRQCISVFILVYRVKVQMSRAEYSNHFRKKNPYSTHKPPKKIFLCHRTYEYSTICIAIENTAIISCNWWIYYNP